MELCYIKIIIIIFLAKNTRHFFLHISVVVVVDIHKSIPNSIFIYFVSQPELAACPFDDVAAVRPDSQPGGASDEPDLLAASVRERATDARTTLGRTEDTERTARHRSSECHHHIVFFI